MINALYTIIYDGRPGTIIIIIFIIIIFIIISDN